MLARIRPGGHIKFETENQTKRERRQTEQNWRQTLQEAMRGRHLTRQTPIQELVAHWMLKLQMLQKISGIHLCLCMRRILVVVIIPFLFSLYTVTFCALK